MSDMPDSERILITILRVASFFFFWIDEFRLTQTPGPVSQSLWLLSHSFFDVLANGGHLILRSEQNGIIASTGTLRIAKKIYYNDNWHVIIPKLIYS